jgi:hypothetical protein
VHLARPDGTEAGAAPGTKLGLRGTVFLDTSLLIELPASPDATASPDGEALGLGSRTAASGFIGASPWCSCWASAPTGKVKSAKSATANCFKETS